jgi:hypothetical protein
LYPPADIDRLILDTKSIPVAKKKKITAGTHHNLIFEKNKSENSTNMSLRGYYPLGGNKWFTADIANVRKDGPTFRKIDDNDNDEYGKPTDGWTRRFDARFDMKKVDGTTKMGWYHTPVLVYTAALKKQGRNLLWNYHRNSYDIFDGEMKLLAMGPDRMSKEMKKWVEHLGLQGFIVTYGGNPGILPIDPSVERKDFEMVYKEEQCNSNDDTSIFPMMASVRSEGSAFSEFKTIWNSPKPEINENPKKKNTSFSDSECEENFNTNNSEDKSECDNKHDWQDDDSSGMPKRYNFETDDDSYDESIIESTGEEYNEKNEINKKNYAVSLSKTKKDKEEDEVSEDKDECFLFDSIVRPDVKSIYVDIKEHADGHVEVREYDDSDTDTVETGWFERKTSFNYTHDDKGGVIKRVERYIRETTILSKTRNIPKRSNDFVHCAGTGVDTENSILGKRKKITKDDCFIASKQSKTEFIDLTMD